MNAKDTSDSFERFLESAQHRLPASKWRPHIIDVADTMYTCKRWFEGSGVSFTGADVVAMAKLILDREAAASASAEAAAQRLLTEAREDEP